jgi:hypothetical protein
MGYYNNLADYWRDRRELREELEHSHPGGIYLVLEDRRHVGKLALSLCPPEVASRSLIDGTHRRGTKEEIDQHLADQEIEAGRLGATQRVRWDTDHETVQKFVAKLPGKREQQ